MNSVSSAGTAIFNEEGKVEVVNSTFFENYAMSGSASAIYNMETGNSPGGVVLSVTNSTFTGNWAQYGAINSTGESPDTVVLNNNLFSNNRGGSCNGGFPFTGIGNLADDESCGAAGFTLVSDLMLGSLSDNGGPTLTVPLLPGSPAIDAGEDFLCPATDQRCLARPQDAHCDIGSFEYKNFVVTSAADSGEGSLRGAIAWSSDPITFAGDYTIRLASQLMINRDVTIDGAGYHVIINGDTNSNGWVKTWRY